MLVVTRGRVSCAKPCGNRKLRDPPKGPIRQRGAFVPINGCRIRKTARSWQAHYEIRRPTGKVKTGYILPAQKLGIRSRPRMEPVAKSDRHRFYNQEVSSDAGAIRGRESGAASDGTFPSPKGNGHRINQKPGEGKSGGGGAKHSGKLGRQGEHTTDRRMAHWRYLYRSGGETLVGINEESA